MYKKQNSQAGFAHFLIPVIALIVLVPIAFFGYKIIRQSTGVDPNNLPKFIKSDFIELDKITSISKFRSSEGHDFSGGGEQCRSMKHYFTPNYNPTVTTNSLEEKIAASKPDNKTDTKVYSPVDGVITNIATERTPIGSQISISVDGHPQFTVRLFHVWTDGSYAGNPSGGLKKGMKVTAGQQIGVLSANQETDISVEYGGKLNQHLVSVFDVMTDDIFAAYQARGLKNRNDVIISKADRDANPLKCSNNNEQSFELPSNYDATSQRVYLSGYVARPKNEGSLGGNGTGAPTPAINNSACSADIPLTQRPPGCQ